MRRLHVADLLHRLEGVRCSGLGWSARGNHFIELQRDDGGRLWAMVHSGSRGVGQAITEHHLARASPTGLGGLVEDAAQAYLSDVEWALGYARANRRWLLAAVAAAVERALGAAAVESSFVDCEHNHARPEVHFGQTLLVHRKGAMPAANGDPGVIPGSMGTCSYHVEGRGLPEALCSSSHGAGRQLPRAVARRRIAPARLRRELRGVYFDAAAAKGLVAEAPSAYKDIGAVMRAQRDLVRIVRVVRPVLSYKGAD